MSIRVLWSAILLLIVFARPKKSWDEWRTTTGLFAEAHVTHSGVRIESHFPIGTIQAGSWRSINLVRTPKDKTRTL
jgi:hypothetical protein